MSNGDFQPGDLPTSVSWRPPRVPGINSHVLTVGHPDFRLGHGIPVNFGTIGEAMDAIPLWDPDLEDPDAHNPTEQWTILVTPGYYPEIIRFKPFVNVVGLLKEAVTIGRPNDGKTHSAQVYLCTRSFLSNVTLAIPGDAAPGYFAVRGYDVNRYPDRHINRGNVHFLGLANVDFVVHRLPSKEQPPGGGLIKFDGHWRTVIFRDVGGNYEAPEGYGIELLGRFQNADCHFINCFFDALFMDGRGEGGFIHIRDCHETHIRNSLLRVDYLNKMGPSHAPITAVKTTQSRPRHDRLPTNVLIEGSSMYGPGPSVLDIGDHTVCFFRHSFSDSKSGNGHFFTSKPDGIGNL
jgi:hypothetical protein